MHRALHSLQQVCQLAQGSPRRTLHPTPSTVSCPCLVSLALPALLSEAARQRLRLSRCDWGAGSTRKWRGYGNWQQIGKMSTAYLANGGSRRTGRLGDEWRPRQAPRPAQMALQDRRVCPSTSSALHTHRYGALRAGERGPLVVPKADVNAPTRGPLAPTTHLAQAAAGPGSWVCRLCVFICTRTLHMCMPAWRRLRPRPCTRAGTGRNHLPGTARNHFRKYVNVTRVTGTGAGTGTKGSIRVYVYVSKDIV